jgi:hypothetical protein
MFLWNVGWFSTDYTALYPIRQYSLVHYSHVHNFLIANIQFGRLQPFYFNFTKSLYRKCTRFNIWIRFFDYYMFEDRLCGLVVRVPGYRSRGHGFDSWRYQIFWEVVGLERGPLSLVRITEELFGRNSSGSGLENQEYGRGDPLRWPRNTLYPQKLPLTSPISGGHSVGIVRLRTKATEFLLFDYYMFCTIWNMSLEELPQFYRYVSFERFKRINGVRQPQRQDGRVRIDCTQAQI